MRRASFDFERFVADINATRQARGLTWRRLAEASGIPASTFSRMNKGNGRMPDSNNLAAIASWGGLSLDDYVVDRMQMHRPRREQIMGLILSDPALEASERQALSQVVRLWYDRATGQPQQEHLDSAAGDDENLAEHSRRTGQRLAEAFADRTQCESFRACVQEPQGCICRMVQHTQE